MNQDKKVIKISDVVENQIPEFIFTENPNFAEFLKQYYISQEFQGGTVDIAENLIEYKNFDSFDSSNLITKTTLSSDIDIFEETIPVVSTKGWPEKYGLLKINDEIITYTGITTNSFTGCVRGFSAIESIVKENDPEYLVFSQSESDFHKDGDSVDNLSNLFLIEFFKKTKSQFIPGFEDLNFDSRIDIPNFISKAKDFYQSKGTDESFEILFKVLFGEKVEVIKPKDFLFAPSDDKWIVVENFVCDLVEGDPLKLNGQTLYQDKNISGSVLESNGSIYSVSSLNIGENIFYKVSIFSGYSNNLNPKGSIFGEFKTTSKTYVVSEVSSNSTTIPVVSTVGFDRSGKLIIDGYEITYTDKTSTEFLNCSGIQSDIKSSTKVYADNFVYSYEDGNINSVVKLRIINTISNVDSSGLVLINEGDKINIKNLGSTEKSVFTESLNYNVPSIIFAGKVFPAETNVGSLDEGVSINGFVKTKYPHYLKDGDAVEVYNSSRGEKITNSIVSNVNSERSFTISDAQNLKNYKNNQIKIRRIPFRSNSSMYPEIDGNFAVNIQNSYEDSNCYYVESNGLPDNNIKPYKKEYSFTCDNDILTIISDSNNESEHYYENGDVVNISNIVGVSTILSTNIDYYIKKINVDEVKIARSLLDVIQNNFITPDIGQVTLTSKSLYGKQFTSSKSFKKILKNIDYTKTEKTTKPGSIGILVNGVEIQNYKSSDKIYFGNLENIKVLNSGSGYDLLNPPTFEINDGTDTTSSIIPQMEGIVESIIVNDPGYDYVETPIVTIKNGSNEEIKTEVRMKLISRELEFNAANSDIVATLDLEEKFIFTEPHRLIVGDGVIYDSSSGTKIGIGTEVSDGTLLDDSVYYVSSIGAGTSFRLAPTYNDAINETNLIKLRTLGTGIQKFTSVKKVKVIDSVNITDDNPVLKYKKVVAREDDINKYDNIINIKNHGFLSGDEISYSYSNGSGLDGILVSQYYYIVKIDDNSFKLSSTKNLNNIVDFDLIDSSVHIFEYSPIRIDILGSLTISGISTIGTSAVLTPVVRGSINDVKIEESDPEYNSNYTEYLNYNLNPTIRVVNGKGAFLQPVITNGKITNVIILSQGENYFNSLEIDVIGVGNGAKLSPVIVNGRITSVSIINKGTGYDSNTTIKIRTIGSNFSAIGEIKSYTLNEVDRYPNSILKRGIIVNDIYHPDQNIYGVYKLTNTLKSLLNLNDSNRHSPIIGWAYDGCPIYGPYAYENPDGTGNIIEMTSSYKKSKVGDIPLGLIEDYSYIENRGSLDKHNGRYCITPEYPNGVYAYFATSEFPYFIGDTYKFTPLPENFDFYHTQNLDYNQLDIVKNTLPYYVEDELNYYDYFDYRPNPEKEEALVLKTLSGDIDSIDVVDSGEGYSIGSKLIFDNTGTGGYGASAEITELSGVGISSIESTTKTIQNITFTSNNNTIIGVATTAHNFKDEYFIKISGITSTTFTSLNGVKKINVDEIVTNLEDALDSESVTGITTSIKIKDSISIFDIDSKIRISNENVTVIGLDYLNNRINILRESSSPSYSVGEYVYLNQNKFYFDEDQSLDLPEANISYYFDSNLVSIGIDTSVGAGNTITSYPLGVGVSQTKYIRTAGIWMPNHRFKSGESVSYSNDSSFLNVQTSLSGQLLSDFSNLYIINFGNDVVGLTTIQNELNGLLYYTSAGTGRLHKLKTNRNIISGQAICNETIVSTASSHGLDVGDKIKLNVTSGLTTNYTVTYSSGNAKLRIDGVNNPEINVYRNQKVVFDTSASSLNKTHFKLYTDSDYKNEYIGTGNSGVEVVVGVNSVTLNIQDTTLSTLYYNIESKSKKVFDDETVFNHNRINVKQSLYNVTSGIVTNTNESFTVNLPYSPEENNYSSSDSNKISYKVRESDVLGPISEVKVTSKGVDYKKIPSIKSVEGDGKDAVLIPITKNIGRVSEIGPLAVNICPSDKTLVPTSNLYSVLYLKNNYKVSAIDLTFSGKNYLSPPEVKLFNTKTNSLEDSFSAFCSLKGNTVEEILIINPGNGLHRFSNKLVFTDNSNGVKILSASSVQDSPSLYTISLTLETPLSGFTTSNPPPFDLNDDIFVENLGTNYDSSDYSYNTFKVVGIVTNYSSENQTILRYQVSKSPGSVLSYDNAYVINSNDLPQANVSLIQSSFIAGEDINGEKSISNKIDNYTNNIVKVEDLESTKVGDDIKGNLSFSEGNVVKIDKFSSKFNVSNSISSKFGWKEFKGKLSVNDQNLSDNDYYQNFSYSLRSKIQISDWNSQVSDLNHIAGFKKFSDLQVESKSTISGQPSNSSSIVNVSINSFGDINTKNNFDLVLEDVDENNNEYSELLKFRSRKLSDYLLSEENRVLSIDNVSSNFNNQTSFAEIIIDTLPTINTGGIVAKYFVLIESTTSLFTDFELPLLAEVFVTKQSDSINGGVSLISYSYFEDIPLGTFTSSLNPQNKNEILLKFSPINVNNIISARTITDYVPLNVSTESNSYGNVNSVAITSTFTAESSPTQKEIILSPLSECQSGSVYVGIASVASQIEEFKEIAFLYDGTNVLSTTYSESELNNLGEIGISTSGSNLVITYDGIANTGVTVYVDSTLIVETQTSPNQIQSDYGLLNSSRSQFTGSSPVGLTTISSNYGVSNFIVEIEKTVGVTLTRSVAQINAVHYDINFLENKYLANITYSTLGNFNDIDFDLTFDPGSNSYTLSYVPSEVGTYDIKLSQKSILRSTNPLL